MNGKKHRPDDPSPGQYPENPGEDFDALERVKAVLASPSYLPADQDIDFLSRYETRNVRLQLDYQKPEMLLSQHGIEHAIVVFGSTRIPEPAEAKRLVEEAREAHLQDPSNAELDNRFQRAQRIAGKSRYYYVARELGRLIGHSGKGPDDCRLLLMTGGGPGIMAAANRGAFDVGAKSIGLNIKLPHEQYPNPYVSPELCFSVHYFAIRKLHFLLRAKALVVFPGGFGTMDELFETLTLVQTGTIDPLPVILVGREFWRGVFDPDYLLQEGVIGAEDRELFWYAETADEIWQGILAWHQAAGTPLTDCGQGNTPE